MSSLALMRWLEGAPERYDVGMRVITFGRVSTLHAAVAAAACGEPGERILEIGCGTGVVTARLCESGARVTALDQSPEMLEQARARLAGRPGGEVEWLEQTASEIDSLPPQSFDAVVICLCLSDMSRNERAYVLREAALRLAPGGRLVVGDEMEAPAGWRRVLQRLWRAPQALFGWLLVGSLSRPLPDLEPTLGAIGLEVVRRESWLLGSLGLLVAEHRA